MESILAEAERLTNGDRRDSYGPPERDYLKVAGMFNALFADKIKEPFTPQEMMLTMILIKLSREAHLHKRDSLVDIAGYANCVQMSYEADRQDEPR